MRKSFSKLFAIVCSFLFAHPAAAAPHAIEDFLRRDTFQQLRLSPDGRHYAATVPHEDKTVLVIFSREDMKLTGTFNLRGNTHVIDFRWVNSERVLLAVGEKFGEREEPIPTGEIFATNADGSRQEVLFGFRGEGGKVGSHIDKGRNEQASASLVDLVPGDDRNVIIAVFPWNQGAEPFTRAERMDVITGRRTVVARAPVRRAEFVTDGRGSVRFAVGAGADNRVKTYYRRGDQAEWELINDESRSDRVVSPIGFGPDDRVAYLRVQEATGPDSIQAFDPETLEMTPALRGEFADPHRILWDPGRRVPVGAMFMEGAPKLRFFDEAGDQARLYKSLQASFGGQPVGIVSATADGRVMLLHAASERSPGDYFLFDAVAKKAEHVVSARAWIDPDRTAGMQPVALKARDGRSLYGYLTVPNGLEAKKLPLIVNPHGGPFGEADVWGFRDETQMLAARGYAVLQVNFRGSGNYGREHLNAGAREWGKAMQDDLTDATRWAIEQGIADPGRICIYGASYGGYAALMGVAREPDLYRCAAGYVGVYDMRMMYTRGDIRQRLSGRNYLEEALGKTDLESISPTRLADRIKVPVFLAAGGRDERAPADHTVAMEKALKKAGVPVETLVYPKEGHGFYADDNRREYYRRLLAFFDRHLAPAAAPAAAAE